MGRRQRNRQRARDERKWGSESRKAFVARTKPALERRQGTKR